MPLKICVAVIVFRVALWGVFLPCPVLANVPPTDANAAQVDLIVRDGYLPDLGYYQSWLD